MIVSVANISVYMPRPDVNTFKNVLCLFCLFLGGEELRFLSGDGKESALPLSLTYVALLCIFERLIPTSQHTYLMSFCLKNSIKYTNSI